MKHLILVAISALLITSSLPALAVERVGKDNPERSLASIRDRSPASDTPRWQVDSKAFQSIEAKPEEHRVQVESDSQDAPSFRKSPYLNYSR